MKTLSSPVNFGKAYLAVWVAVFAAYLNTVNFWSTASAPSPFDVFLYGFVVFVVFVVWLINTALIESIRYLVEQITDSWPTALVMTHGFAFWMAWYYFDALVQNMNEKAAWAASGAESGAQDLILNFAVSPHFYITLVALSLISDIWLRTKLSPSPSSQTGVAP
jgi:hypothetical protein